MENKNLALVFSIVACLLIVALETRIYNMVFITVSNVNFTISSLSVREAGDGSVKMSFEFVVSNPVGYSDLYVRSLNFRVSAVSNGSRGYVGVFEEIFNVQVQPYGETVIPLSFVVHGNSAEKLRTADEVEFEMKIRLETPMGEFPVWTSFESSLKHERGY